MLLSSGLLLYHYRYLVCSLEYTRKLFSRFCLIFQCTYGLSYLIVTEKYRNMFEGAYCPVAAA